MIKLKVLEKLKTKKKEPVHNSKEMSQDTPEKNVQSEIDQDSQEPTLTKYEETLYSDNVTHEKDVLHQGGDSVLPEQRIWRDVKAVEENVDNISKHPSKEFGIELDKKIDGILSNKKKTFIKNEEKSRKPSNVIYVVSKPQPGQVRGDWAVRSHGKIFSHHRLKENAIAQARNIARERNATVLVQNTDGTFSEGFKPRPKK